MCRYDVAQNGRYRKISLTLRGILHISDGQHVRYYLGPFWIKLFIVNCFSNGWWLPVVLRFWIVSILLYSVAWPLSKELHLCHGHAFARLIKRARYCARTIQFLGSNSVPAVTMSWSAIHKCYRCTLLTDSNANKGTPPFSTCLKFSMSMLVAGFDVCVHSLHFPRSG